MGRSDQIFDEFLRLEVPDGLLTEVQQKITSETKLKKQLGKLAFILIKNGRGKKEIVQLLQRLKIRHRALRPAFRISTFYETKLRYFKRNKSDIDRKIDDLLRTSRTIKWSGRNGLVQKRVYEGILKIARKSGKTANLDVSERELAEMAGGDRKTCRTVTESLQNLGKIILNQDRKHGETKQLKITTPAKPIHSRPRRSSNYEITFEQLVERSTEIIARKTSHQRRTNRTYIPKFIDFASPKSPLWFQNKILHLSYAGSSQYEVTIGIDLSQISQYFYQRAQEESTPVLWKDFLPIHSHYDVFAARGLGANALCIYELLSSIRSPINNRQLVELTQLSGRVISHAITKLKKNGLIKIQGDLLKVNREADLIKIAKQLGVNGLLRKKQKKHRKDRSEYGTWKDMPLSNPNPKMRGGRGSFAEEE